MGFERAGNRRGAARHDHHDLARQVQAGKVVMPLVGQMQPISGKDHWCVDLLGHRSTPAGKDKVAGHGQGRVAIRPTQDSTAATGLNDLFDKGDRLLVPIGPHGFQAKRLECVDDIGRRLVIAGRAGAASLHLVAGQRLHMPPPSRAVIRDGILGRQGWRQEHERREWQCQG